MHASLPDSAGWKSRNWLFVKVFTDAGIYGVGEASGWPRVVETAIKDLSTLLIGDNPFEIEKLWQNVADAAEAQANGPAPKKRAKARGNARAGRGKTR